MPGMTWYCKIARMASLRLYLKASPIWEFSILEKASSLGTRMVMSCWKEILA